MKIKEFEILANVAKMFGAEYSVEKLTSTYLSFKCEGSGISVRLDFMKDSLPRIIIRGSLDCYFRETTVGCYPLLFFTSQEELLLMGCGAISFSNGLKLEINESDFFTFLYEYIKSKQQNRHRLIRPTSLTKR